MKDFAASTTSATTSAANIVTAPANGGLEIDEMKYAKDNFGHWQLPSIWYCQAQKGSSQSAPHLSYVAHLATLEHALEHTLERSGMYAKAECMSLNQPGIAG